MDHPMVAEMERTGYPRGRALEVYGTDALDNEVYEGDRILVLNGEFYLVETLMSDSIEILETHGAHYEIAE